MPSTWQLQTARLRLRPYRPDDVTPMRAVFGDPEVMRFSQSGGDKTFEETADRVQRLIDHQAEFDFSLWIVEDRATGAILGDCGLKQLEAGPEIEVGYRFGKAAWGKGYATEAAAASIEYGFTTLALPRIVAVVDPANTASCRVIEKIGLTYRHRALHYGRQLNYYTADREPYLARHGLTTPK